MKKATKIFDFTLTLKMCDVKMKVHYYISYNHGDMAQKFLPDDRKSSDYEKSSLLIRNYLFLFVEKDFLPGRIAFS